MNPTYIPQTVVLACASQGNAGRASADLILYRYILTENIACQASLWMPTVWAPCWGMHQTDASLLNIADSCPQIIHLQFVSIGTGARQGYAFTYCLRFFMVLVTSYHVACQGKRPSGKGLSKQAQWGQDTWLQFLAARGTVGRRTSCSHCN